MTSNRSCYYQLNPPSLSPNTNEQTLHTGTSACALPADLLEQIYEGATIRLAPNDEESATITFITGVVQGSITSPQLFNILINALLRMLMVTGQNEDISHGLQIGKDQKGDNQRNETVINSTT